jgi:fructose-1,6-bisphosphatase/inositol monophosphatase family enzyme
MTAMPNFATELEFAKALASEAAAVAKRRCHHVTPEEKANLSYVTDLDRDVETMIRERLAARFPEDALSGEEYAVSGGKGPRRWSIDPIDGTGNLVHGLPLWSISIGLIVAGEPTLGVIVIPPLDELFWAVKGAGAWLGDERLHARDAAIFHDQDNVCASTNALRCVDPRSLPGRLRAIVRGVQSPSSLDLARRARARHRRGYRHHERGRLRVWQSRRRAPDSFGNDPPHTNQDADIHRSTRSPDSTSGNGTPALSAMNPKNRWIKQLTTDH